jgi:four helix bundle protein
MERDLLPRTYLLARKVITFYASLSKSTVAQVLGKQLLRSGTSVGANYREANQGRSRADFLAKMGDCLKELSETDYWLELLSAEDFGDKSGCEDLLQETRELIAIFTTIIKNTKQNAP